MRFFIKNIDKCFTYYFSFFLRVCHAFQFGKKYTRSLYRLYRDLGSDTAGVLLLHLADYLAIHGPDIDLAALRSHLAVVAFMLAPAFPDPNAADATPILPTALLDGHEIMNLTGFPPSRHIGVLLEALREAQAVGEVGDREQAERFIIRRAKQVGPTDAAPS